MASRVDADTGKLLWTVPLRSPYGVNVATPVYGAGRIFYATPYVYGTCYQLQPGEEGPQPEKAWDTTLDTCTGTVLLVDGLLYGSGYKKHKSWLCLDWKSGQIRYELKGLTTGAAVYADGRLYCLTEDGRAALLRPRPSGSRSTASSGSCPRGSAMPGHIRSCSTAGCTCAITIAFGAKNPIARTPASTFRESSDGNHATSVAAVGGYRGRPASAVPISAAERSIPRLQQKRQRHELMVDGQPFGACRELHNSSGSGVEYMRQM